MEYSLWKLKIFRDISKLFLLVISKKNISIIQLNKLLRKPKHINMILISHKMVNIISLFIKKH